MCFLAGLAGALIALLAIPIEKDPDDPMSGVLVAVGDLLFFGSLFVFWIAIPGFLAVRRFWRWPHREVTATEGTENTWTED
jgi:hypothetical protein